MRLEASKPASFPLGGKGVFGLAWSGLARLGLVEGTSEVQAKVVAKVQAKVVADSGSACTSEVVPIAITSPRLARPPLMYVGQ
jgi:hypothetical protein